LQEKRPDELINAVKSKDAGNIESKVREITSAQGEKEMGGITRWALRVVAASGLLAGVSIAIREKCYKARASTNILLAGSILLSSFITASCLPSEVPTPITEQGGESVSLIGEQALQGNKDQGQQQPAITPIPTVRPAETQGQSLLGSDDESSDAKQTAMAQEQYYREIEESKEDTKDAEANDIGKVNFNRLVELLFAMDPKEISNYEGEDLLTESQVKEFFGSGEEVEYKILEIEDFISYYIAEYIQAKAPIKYQIPQFLEKAIAERFSGEGDFIYSVKSDANSSNRPDFWEFRVVGFKQGGYGVYLVRPWDNGKALLAPLEEGNRKYSTWHHQGEVGTNIKKFVLPGQRLFGKLDFLKIARRDPLVVQKDEEGKIVAVLNPEATVPDYKNTWLLREGTENLLDPDSDTIDYKERQLTNEELELLKAEYGELTSGYEAELEPGHKLRIVTNLPFKITDINVRQLKRNLGEVGFDYTRDLLTTVEIRDFANIDSEKLYHSKNDILEYMLDINDKRYLALLLPYSTDYYLTKRYIVYLSKEFLYNNDINYEGSLGRSKNMNQVEVFYCVITGLMANKDWARDYGHTIHVNRFLDTTNPFTTDPIKIELLD
jgi:hypothetical protein